MTWPADLDGKTWKAQTGTITSDELKRAYNALQNGDERKFLQALDVLSFSERKADRAIAVLKRRGLVAYNQKARKWETT